MSSPVVAKEFLWKFRDEITQGVAKARQAMQEAVSVAKEAGMKVSDTGEDWKKMGNDAENSARKASQAVKESANASRESIEKVRVLTEKLNDTVARIPTSKSFNLKAKFDDNKLKTFSRKIHDIPKQKSLWLRIKDGFSNYLKNAQQDADNTKKSFSNLREVMTGTFLGNAVLNGIHGISNGLKGLIATGYQYTRQQQTMIASWNTLTGSASKGQEMVDMTNKLAISAQNSTEMVNDLNQKFYAVTNSAGKTKDLSQAVLTLQDAFNQSDASIENFSTQWAQMVGNGKASAQDMLSIQNVFPKFRQELLAYERDATHNKNLTMQQMNDMMSQGKISSKAMNDVLIGMGHKYQDATKNFTNTLDGMGRIIKTTAPRLLGAMVEPFTKAQNPIYKAVSNWVSDPRTLKEFQNAGKNIANTFNSTLNGLSTAFHGLGQVMGPVMKSFGSGAWVGFSTTLKVIAEGLVTITSFAGKVASSITGISKRLGFLKIQQAAAKALGVAFGGLVAVIATYKTVSLASTAVTKTFAAAQAALNVVMDANPIGLVVLAITALVGAFVLAYKHIKPFRDMVNKTGEAIKKLFTGKYDWEQSFGKGLSKLGKSFQNFAKKIPQFFKGVGKAIIKTIVIGLALPVGIGITLMKPLIKPLQNSTKSLIKTVQKQWQSLSKWLGKLFDPVAKLWNRVWNGWARIFSTVWKSLKKTASSGMKAIERLISPAVKAIEKVWVTSWDAIASFFSGIWHTITSLGGNGMRMLHSAIAGPLNTISSIWHSVWNSVSSFFRGIWNGIKQAAQDGMNGVINVINAGIGGINKVWSFFTGHGTGVKELGHVHFAQGGTVHRHLSVINDGDGPDWKELVQTPDGNLFMSQERNWTGFLPEGTRVYSGAETRQIMNTVGVSHYAAGGIVGAQHFADGGIIGEGIDWAKGSLENIGSWLGDKFSALEDFLADPLKATKGLLEKATSGLYKGLGNFADVAHGAMDKLTQPIADWFKKGLEKLEAQFESGGASPDLIRAAAAKMHVAISGADISHIMNVIKHESGGNARAINNWDSNAKAGHPSKGILQFIDGTFRKYAVAGHTNIYSPFDQLLAMFNDTTWRSDLTLGGWGPTGGRRFATGGEVFGLTNAIIGDNPEHHEFVLNPYAVSAEPLLDRAFEATAQAQPANSSTGNGNSKLDQMIDLLGKVLVAIENQETDIYLDGEKITDNSNKRNAKNWSLRKGILS
ncbi:tape measure protein [Limosilactobacillus reuteri]|uniref:Lytic transglycosylase, catalytic n=2 Tax=Limosilactobacillus reuteri TaxID=1598 RepID=A5VJT5_LIMRD|nr:tape measure protein [Limosilactobacillus reuteri]AYN56737.1 putative tape-measure protein [Lactobacillus phage LR1]ABQ83109.1 Lytic transglycosylase, catalytic [Limosilactobacillus reuteri subsp. reuteri]AKP01087.1 lytic transglycosylase [Limosilactobacillus reuteri]EEI08244.1 transglycosylase SLT domain protein [Limosilactobacillus reuteri MM2-3]EGC15173.1 transglycosylase SLT domain protein [Limosilactobacillus reuteri MM4-1A]